MFFSAEILYAATKKPKLYPEFYGKASIDEHQGFEQGGIKGHIFPAPIFLGISDGPIAFFGQNFYLLQYFFAKGSLVPFYFPLKDGVRKKFPEFIDFPRIMSFKDAIDFLRIVIIGCAFMDGFHLEQMSIVIGLNAQINLDIL